jgi:hypothetical protein
MKFDRRRLLKGSLAAPLVLTVRPASAQAVASAVSCLKQCGVDALHDNPPKVTYSLRSDEWLRVQFDVCRLAPSINKPFYSGKYFLGFNKYTYWRLDDQNPLSAPAQETQYTKASCYAEKTGEKLYGIAYIDNTGTIKGFAWDHQWQDTPVTWSCYTSAVGLKYKA